MKKKYFNQEAYDYVASQINKTRIHPVFRPIIIDIILRRRYEFQLDDKYFHRDVESFINNVKDIYCEDLQDKHLAEFLPRKKCIRINKNKFKNNMHNEQEMEHILDFICHECQHAMNSDGTMIDRTFSENKSAIDNIGIIEIFSEKEADRMVYNRKLEDSFKYLKETSGYGATTEFVDAIAAAFGIKEKELLSATIKGKQELYEVLNVNIKNQDFAKTIFEDICFNINIAHIEIYRDPYNPNTWKSENIWNSLNFIYRNIEQILEYRIENLEWDTIGDLQQKLEDIKLSQNAISNIMKESVLQTLAEVKGKEALALDNKKRVYAKVMCIEEIIKSKAKNSKELISFVQKLKNADEILEFMKQNGIEINSENLAQMPEFEISKKKKDEWIKEFCLDSEEWDNTEIIDYMINNKERIMNAKERLSFSNIMRKITRIANRTTEVRNRFYKRFLAFPKKIFRMLSKKSNEETLLLGDGKEEKTKSWDVSNWGLDKQWVQNAQNRISQEHNALSEDKSNRDVGTDRSDGD